MKKSEAAYYAKNYETVLTSSAPIVIDDFTTANYRLTKRNGSNKEFMVWITKTTICDGMEFVSTIKAVVLDCQTEHRALFEAFNKYFKNFRWGFSFGKDFKLT